MRGQENQSHGCMKAPVGFTPCTEEGPSPRGLLLTHLPELPRVSFKLIELGLIALQEFLNGLDELDVPLLEVFRYQV